MVLYLIIYDSPFNIFDALIFFSIKERVGLPIQGRDVNELVNKKKVIICPHVLKTKKNEYIS